MSSTTPSAVKSDREDRVRTAIAIALSGGGYRAMLFHTGALWRLGQLGLLSTREQIRHADDGSTVEFGRLQRISSVSGGSIVSAVLASAFDDLSPLDGDAFEREFDSRVVKPVRRLASVTLAGASRRGVWEVLKDVVLPGSINDRIAAAYDRHLYGGKTLQDLPDSIRFVFNASNLQSGGLWRFSKPYMRDWRVGEVRNPTVSLAKAVAASSAFPPVLAPASLKLRDSDYVPGSGDGLQQPPYTTSPTLADGGVYDNLGLETCKSFRTLLVSNGGKPFDPDPKISSDWVSIGARCLSLVDNQVYSLRVRELIDAYANGRRTGAFWDIKQDIAVYDCEGRLPCPVERTRRLAAVATDLAAKDADLQERLINWGYAVADASLRTWFDRSMHPPSRFPYPARGI